MTPRTGNEPILFHSSVERKPLFYLLAAAAVVGPAVVVAIGVPYVWAESRQTAYILAAAATADFLATWFVAFIIRWQEVTFDGRHVGIGSRVFKTSIPVENITDAQVIRPPEGASTSGQPGRNEFIRLTTAAGVYTSPCVNAETLVQLLWNYRSGGR